MDNTAHSFTEAAEYTPESTPNKPLKPHSLLKLYWNTLMSPWR